MDWKRKLTSRKWWAAIIVLVVGLLNAVLGWELSPEEIAAIVAPVIVYIIGEAIADLKK